MKTVLQKESPSLKELIAAKIKNKAGNNYFLNPSLVLAQIGKKNRWLFYQICFMLKNLAIS